MKKLQTKMDTHTHNVEYLKGNLFKLRKLKGLTQAEQAEVYNVKRTAYANYESGTSKPDLVTLFSIAKENNISIDELFRPDLEEILESRSLSGDDTVDGLIGKNSNQKIPLIPNKAFAGINHTSVQIMDHEIEQYFHIPVLKEKADFIWQIEGESMTPTYPSSSYVTCKTIESDQVKWERPYLITVNYAPMVKRLLPSSNPKNLICRSDNEKFRDFEVTKKDVNSVSKILASFHLE